MPFGIRIGKRSQQYNVANKDLFVIPIEIQTNEPIECTLFATSVGQECLNNVCQRLGLQQTEYFGLLFKSKRGINQWVDLLKPLKKQLDKYSVESRLFLRLQYFVPNLHFLSDEVSRYHYFCAMKLLVIEDRLQCNREEAVHLASFNLQAEFGDFSPERHTAEYLNNFVLFPRSMISNNKVTQDVLMECVINSYRNLQGVQPNVAEIYYISEAQQLNGYGQEGFPAKDTDSGVEVCLGVSLRGIFVVHYNSQKTELFKWTDIANLIHQKKVFTIEQNPDGMRKNYSTFDSDYASCIWRTCVEQHQYFMKGLRNSSDADSQQSDQSKPEITTTNNNSNATNNLQNNQNMTSININSDQTHNLLKSQLLPQALHSGQFVDSVSVNTDNNNELLRFQHNREYSIPNTRELNTCNAEHSLYKFVDNLDNNLFGARSSADTTDLHQIHVSFTDKSDIKLTPFESQTNVSNITTVQVHHQPSWALTDQQQCETELTYEQRKQLLPPYKHPPDYETFMRQKYGNLSASVGNIPSCLGSCASHQLPTSFTTNGFVMSSASTSASSVPHFIQQHPYAQYRNYNDLSNLEIDQSGGRNNSSSKVSDRSSLPPTQNWLQSDHPIGSPLRAHQLTSGIITCSTPELNSLNIAKNDNIFDEKLFAYNHQLLYLINNNRPPPPYSFNSVPDLSCQQFLQLQQIQNIDKPIVAFNHNNNHLKQQQSSGSEPNISNIPLMTAFSTNVNQSHPNSTSTAINLSVEKLAKSNSIHKSQTLINEMSEVKPHLQQAQQPSNNISNLQTLQNIYTISQRQQQSVRNNQIQPLSEALSSRMLTQLSTNTANSIVKNVENRSSSEITSTIGSYLVKTSESNGISAANKDHRVYALEETLNDPEFMREFDLLPRMNPTAKFTTALMQENIYRNRFRDILPYEDNRVKLMPTKENKSGYINASHIIMNLGNMRHHYIASQGPLSNTTIDFWQMVWEQSVNLIVMVTNFNELNQQKCFQYLPLTHEPPNNTLRFGDYEILCNYTSMSITFITSLLTITFNGQKRNITHLRFTEWSDHSCPDDVQGFLAFLSEMDAIHRRSCREGSGFGKKKSVTVPPILVHCSAGVGRSGVVILCDSLLKFLDYNNSEILDVPKSLTQLRFQRMLSVQHCQQFRFVCKVLSQYLANSRLI